ncbi:MAG: hypothetical protein HY841_04550, partial [Bacteroidetes bacterium]|nr:hypothetical protein [Bacteroidota bacterium]
MNKIIIPIIVILIIAAGIGAFFILQKPAFPEPEISRYNVFMMHFEPRSADDEFFQRFKERVYFAKEHNQKFSLGFTPQWTEMILNDPEKLNFVQGLFDEGWDMAPQHHGPHHGWDWDGYCNYGAERCMKLREKYYRGHPSPVMKWWYAEKEQYNGDMNDYMKLMNRLYPFKVMEMGPDKFFDWPPEIQFSTTGKADFFLPSGFPVFDEPVGFPDVTAIPGLTHFEKSTDYYNRKLVYECSMRAIITRDALEEAKKDYETLQKIGKENEFMATVIHIEDDEAIFKDWIKYLYGKDPRGVYSKTITEMANQFSISQNGEPKSTNLKYQDSPFGMHSAYSRPYITDDMKPEEIYKLIAEVKEPYKHGQNMGIRWVRPNSDIYWSVVQPTLEQKKNGIFDWTVYDMFHGRAPSGVNILGTIDARPWGPSGSNDPTFKPYTWDFADEEMERYYIKFVQETVERYDGDGIKDMPGLKNPIKYWQVSNEPAPRPLVADPQGFSHLVEITYKAIKEKNPEAKIALGGMAGGHGFASKDPLTFREVHEFYLPILKNLSGKYIDIFDIHYYGVEWKGMKDAYDYFRRALDETGYQNTEIWFTET